MMILTAGGVRTMAQVLPEMNSDRRRKFMKKRSIGILLLGLVVCTCISGCSSQSIADVNEKSIQAQEETETKDEKKDVVIKKQRIQQENYLEKRQRRYRREIGYCQEMKWRHIVE